jgi:hypothetical protein
MQMALRIASLKTSPQREKMVILRKPEFSDIAEVKKLYEQSTSFHQPWTYAPRDYEVYISQENRYFVCSATNGNILGTFHIPASCVAIFNRRI